MIKIQSFSNKALFIRKTKKDMKTLLIAAFVCGVIYLLIEVLEISVKIYKRCIRLIAKGTSGLPKI